LPTATRSTHTHSHRLPSTRRQSLTAHDWAHMRRPSSPTAPWDSDGTCVRPHAQLAAPQRHWQAKLCRRHYTVHTSLHTPPPAFKSHALTASAARTVPRRWLLCWRHHGRSTVHRVRILLSGAIRRRNQARGGARGSPRSARPSLVGARLGRRQCASRLATQTHRDPREREVCRRESTTAHEARRGCDHLIAI